MTARRIQPPTIAALVVVALTIGLTIRFSTFVPWGTDSAAYISAASRWAAGDLFSPASFVFWAPWSLDGAIEAPLGHLPGPIKGTIVGVYPLGYPVLLAAALKLGGPLAPYLVAPLFAGLLAWCAYRLASELSGPWAGVMASVLIAASPITLANAVQPMSDVPAAALWALSWVMSLRSRLASVLVAGLAASLAIMVRPNLAPLAGVIAVLATTVPVRESGRTIRLLTFLVGAAVGPALVLWSQSVLYGHPLTTGYGSFSAFFDSERILVNLVVYPQMLLGLYGWPLVIGVLLFPVMFAFASTIAERRRRAHIALGTTGIIVVNFALYLAYLTFEGWEWLRFMLPALLALFVLFAATLDRLRSLMAPRLGALSLVMLIPFLLVALKPRGEIRQVLRDTPNQRRVTVMGHYLRETVRANTVALTYLQSAAVAHYTNRPVIRLELVEPAMLDTVLNDLTHRGYEPAFVIDEAMEGAAFRARFAGSRYQALEWPARAEFWSDTRLSYYRPADRMAFPNDEPYAVDVLRWPAPYQHLRADGNSLNRLFPPIHETVAFRQMLETKYRDDLQRPADATALDQRSSVMWLQRYLRYRLHACSHALAMNNVFLQISQSVVPAVCGPRSVQAQPPRDEVVAFRQQLETAYRTEHARARDTTHVDIEGDGVWMQEYLRHRLDNCSHERAATRVLALIDGVGIQPGC